MAQHLNSAYIVIAEESVLALFADFPKAVNVKAAIAVNKINRFAVDLKYVSKRLFGITFLTLQFQLLEDVKISTCAPAYLFDGSSCKIDIWVFFYPQLIY